MNVTHMTCRLCGGSAAELWKGPLLDLTVRYWQCANCEYVQTEEPYWLDRAYAHSINDSDTGIMARNLTNARIVLATLFATGNLHQRVVDVAGGYGILTRLLRDRGIAALWSDRYSENLLARGFEHAGEAADLVTAFEAFEHFVHPSVELAKMAAIAPNLLLSTEIIPSPAPRPEQWWYYGREHGQHIGFYTLNTLQVLAAKHGRNLVSDGRSYHLMTARRISGRYWRGCLRIQKLLPMLAGRTLKSKTWEDHLRLTH